MIKVSFGAKSLDQIRTNDHNKSKSQKAKDQKRMNQKLASIISDAGEVIRRQIEENEKKNAQDEKTDGSDEKKEETN